MTNQDPTELYVGKREAVMAEVGTPSFYEGKYLAQPIGEADFLPEGMNTLKDLKAIVAIYKQAFPGIRVCWLQ